MSIDKKIQEHEAKLEKCRTTGCYTGQYDLEPNGSYASCTYFADRDPDLKKCPYKIITDDCYGEIHLCRIWKYNNDNLVKKK